MITINEIKIKANRVWENGDFLSAYLKDEDFFPFEISLKKYSGIALSKKFIEIKDWIEKLKLNSNEHKKYSYNIEYEEINNRLIGKQLIPRKIVFETKIDYLNFISKVEKFDLFIETIDKVCLTIPLLRSLFINKPHLIFNHFRSWDEISVVCNYFLKNGIPKKYIRELDIQNIDTKFIENNKKILSQIFDIIIQKEKINFTVTGLTGFSFEKKYGFLYDEPLIRFRILDEKSQIIPGVDDLSLPLSQFEKLKLNIDTVFVTENKINGLCFPRFDRAIVIFGLGYGVKSLENIYWMREKKIYYWGDIDKDGYAILSQMRGYYPQTISFLMDEETLFNHKKLWTKDLSPKRNNPKLYNLSSNEQKIYLGLIEDKYTENLRFEQERVGFEFLQKRLITNFNI